MVVHEPLRPVLRITDTVCYSDGIKVDARAPQELTTSSNAWPLTYDSNIAPMRGLLIARSKHSSLMRCVSHLVSYRGNLLH